MYQAVAARESRASLNLARIETAASMYFSLSFFVWAHLFSFALAIACYFIFVCLGIDDMSYFIEVPRFFSILKLKSVLYSCAC